MSETIDLLKNRASLRIYDEMPIPGYAVDKIIECAMRAPTAGNMMNYSIIVIEDEAKKEILSRTCDNQAFIAKAPLVLIFAADLQKLYDYYIINNVPEYCDKNGKAFKRPSSANLFLAMSDALIAAQNAVIAGEAIGIGSCYIGDIMENYEEHKRLLNLPEFVFPIAMLCMGYYPDGHRKVLKERFDTSYMVFKDEYRRLSCEDLKDMYSGWNSRFKISNQYAADNFAQMHYAFKVGADFTLEMERSIKEVLKIWNGENVSVSK